MVQIVVGLAEPAPSHLVHGDLVRDGSINVDQHGDSVLIAA